MKISKAEIGEGYLNLVFHNDYKLAVPLGEFYFLEDATDDQIENIQLLKGTKVYWPDLEETVILQNFKNRLFTNHKVHLVDQVNREHNRESRYGSNYITGYCGNSFYKDERHKMTTKLDECTCNTCMRSIKSKSRPVGHITSYFNGIEYLHVDSPDGTLWIHPIVKRVD